MPASVISTFRQPAGRSTATLSGVPRVVASGPPAPAVMSGIPDGSVVSREGPGDGPAERPARASQPSTSVARTRTTAARRRDECITTAGYRSAAGAHRRRERLAVALGPGIELDERPVRRGDAEARFGTARLGEDREHRRDLLRGARGHELLPVVPDERAAEESAGWI